MVANKWGKCPVQLKSIKGFEMSSPSVSGTRDKATPDQHQYFFLICFMSNHHIKKLWLIRCKLRTPDLKAVWDVKSWKHKANQIFLSQPCIISLSCSFPKHTNQILHNVVQTHKQDNLRGRCWQRDVIPASTRMLSWEASRRRKSDTFEQHWEQKQ
jgi:hypothetical protein